MSVGGGNVDKNISINIVAAIQYCRYIEDSKIIGIVGKDGGYTKEFANAVVVIPTSDKNVTPITEGFQSIIWHLLVSHPKLKINGTIW